MVRTFSTAVLLAVGLAVPAGAGTFAEMFPQHADLEPGPARDFLESLDYRQGKIALKGGFAEVNVPEGYYFLGPDDAEAVLVDAWGNPQGDAPPLGMIFRSDMTPLDEGGWAVEITWDEIGYVSDSDADEIDYDDLLAEMKSDVRDESEWRRQNGYEPLALVGWAVPPHYDRETRRLHWAKELKFGTDAVNTLNYNMRILGRKGVLVMNFIAGMDALPDVQAALPDVLALASFKEGLRYGDFDPSVDKVAAVGIGGLIAGKVLAKTGLLAMAILFLKKGWFIVVLALGGLWKMLSGRRSA